MITLLEGENSDVITVYSGLTAIGGVTRESDGCWYWALFAVRLTQDNLDPSTDQPLGGSAVTKEIAIDRLWERWTTWLTATDLRAHRDVLRSANRFENSTVRRRSTDGAAAAR